MTQWSNLRLLLRIFITHNNLLSVLYLGISFDRTSNYKHISINECEFPNDLVETSSHFKKTTLEKVLDDIYKKKRLMCHLPES